jgi:hypothetical protein
VTAYSVYEVTACMHTALQLIRSDAVTAEASLRTKLHLQTLVHFLLLRDANNVVNHTSQNAQRHTLAAIVQSGTFFILGASVRLPRDL